MIGYIILKEILMAYNRCIYKTQKSIIQREEA
ncbi:MAG: hypothetical protein RL557_532 [archaeon]|jgi:hypothetical protein